MISWCANQQGSSILETITISHAIFEKIYKKLFILMDNDNKSGRKFGGMGSVVQIDETMLNYKCKSHRGRSLKIKPML
jgi:hypothetical protein